MRADHPQRLRERTPQTRPGGITQWNLAPRLGWPAARAIIVAYATHKFRKVRTRILAVGFRYGRCV